MASGGYVYFCLYSPSSERKSGMPLSVLTPAPPKNTARLELSKILFSFKTSSRRISCILSPVFVQFIFSDAFGNKTVKSVRRVAFRNDQKDHEQNDEKRRAEGQVHFMAEIAARP